MATNLAALEAGGGILVLPPALVAVRRDYSTFCVRSPLTDRWAPRGYAPHVMRVALRSLADANHERRRKRNDPD